ncbi:DUF6368 family protein [Streptacidiphilus sp. PAMC 29251]
MISIALPQPFTDQLEARLNSCLVELVTQSFEHPRPGYWHLSVDPLRLGITESDREGPRPFLLEVDGPGYGDGDYFEQGRFAEPESEYLPALLGFKPANMISVIAMCNGTVDHAVTALLTAAITDVIGGTADVELLDRQVDLVRTLPGLFHLATKTLDYRPFALGAGAFLRAFAATPNFRLLK